jgi:hypothetical protein
MACRAETGERNLTVRVARMARPVEVDAHGMCPTSNNASSDESDVEIDRRFRSDDSLELPLQDPGRSGLCPVRRKPWRCPGQGEVPTCVSIADGMQGAACPEQSRPGVSSRCTVLVDRAGACHGNTQQQISQLGSGRMFTRFGRFAMGTLLVPLVAGLSQLEECCAGRDGAEPMQEHRGTPSSPHRSHGAPPLPFLTRKPGTRPMDAVSSTLSSGRAAARSPRRKWANRRPADRAPSPAAASRATGRPSTTWPASSPSTSDGGRPLLPGRRPEGAERRRRVHAGAP